MYGENGGRKKNGDDPGYESEHYTTGRYDTICGERIITFDGSMRFRVCNDGMVWFDTGDPMLPSVPICEGKRFLLGDMPELDFILSLTDRVESTVPRNCTTLYARNDLGDNGGKLEFSYVIETFGSEIETMRCELSVFPTEEMTDYIPPTSCYVPDGIQDRS